MKRKKSSFSFITDLTLRKKIENAIEITSFLFLKRSEPGISTGFATEIQRMEVLYAASIIEAVLLHMFKRLGGTMSKIDYKDIHTLPAMYQLYPNTALVFAKQIQVPRPDRKLMLDNLIDHFFKNGMIKRDLKRKIDGARKVRNTFHLAKSRKGIRCSPIAVNSAYDAAIETLSVARSVLSQSQGA